MKLFLDGGAGAGRDTVAGYLRDAYGYHQFAIADYLRSVVKEVGGGG